VTVLELGIEDGVQLVETNPRDQASGFWQANPLAKIPALELEDGRVIYDSPVICEYLSATCGKGRLLEGSGRDPWDIRTLAALADGAMDAAMLVRLELTRPEGERSSTDMVTGILDGLRWLGLNWDEGPDVGGPHAPYFQSQRLDRYHEAAARLHATGHAYYCYCTAERLREERERAEARGEAWQYDRTCLALSNDQP